MRGKRNQHEWSYMGVSKGNEQGLLKGELAYCDLCKKYRVCIAGPNGGYFFIPKKEYLKLKIPGSENW